MDPIEEMTAQQIKRVYHECARWIAESDEKLDSPKVLSTGDYMLDLRYEYADRTNRDIEED